jgi:hypothetical protein
VTVGVECAQQRDGLSKLTLPEGDDRPGRRVGESQLAGKDRYSAKCSYHGVGEVNWPATQELPRMESLYVVPTWEGFGEAVGTDKVAAKMMSSLPPVPRFLCLEAKSETS